MAMKSKYQEVYNTANKQFKHIHEVWELWIVMVCEYEC